MDKSVELHLGEANRIINTRDKSGVWHMGQVVYHLLHIASIQEARISSLEQELKEAK